jgi:DNA-binding NtrC family response regulator
MVGEVVEWVRTNRNLGNIASETLARLVIGSHPSKLAYREALKYFEKVYFTDLLAASDGNKTKAAELAELDRTALHSHLRKLGDD